jgi:hypothetical protein
MSILADDLVVSGLARDVLKKSTSIELESHSVHAIHIARVRLTRLGLDRFARRWVHTGGMGPA